MCCNFLGERVGLTITSPKKPTLPETNSQFGPENQWLEDEFPFGMAYFRGYVSLPPLKMGGFE